MSDSTEVSFAELEAAYAKSYSEVFDESTFMDEGKLEVLLTKEEKEAKARWACGSSSGTRCATPLHLFQGADRVPGYPSEPRRLDSLV